MTDHLLRFEALSHENPTAFRALLHSNAFASRFNLLTEVRNIIKEAGLDVFFYKSMEDDILSGNFDVMYLDDRLVGENKARVKAQKRMTVLKSESIKRQKQGMPLFEILFGSCCC